MQNWPYVNFTYLNIEHFLFKPPKSDLARMWEYLTVEAVFPSTSESGVMFFDHYAGEYKSQRNEFNEYLEKLNADGWKLTMSGPLFEGKSYFFRRLKFRRIIE